MNYELTTNEKDRLVLVTKAQFRGRKQSYHAATLISNAVSETAMTVVRQ